MNNSNIKNILFYKKNENIDNLTNSSIITENNNNLPLFVQRQYYNILPFLLKRKIFSVINSRFYGYTFFFATFLTIFLLKFLTSKYEFVERILCPKSPILTFLKQFFIATLWNYILKDFFIDGYLKHCNSSFEIFNNNRPGQQENSKQQNIEDNRINSIIFRNVLYSSPLDVSLAKHISFIVYALIDFVGIFMFEYLIVRYFQFNFIFEKVSITGFKFADLYNNIFFAYLCLTGVFLKLSFNGLSHAINHKIKILNEHEHKLSVSFLYFWEFILKLISYLFFEFAFTYLIILPWMTVVINGPESLPFRYFFENIVVVIIKFFKGNYLLNGLFLNSLIIVGSFFIYTYYYHIVMKLEEEIKKNNQ